MGWELMISSVAQNIQFIWLQVLINFTILKVLTLDGDLMDVVRVQILEVFS